MAGFTKGSSPITRRRASAMRSTPIVMSMSVISRRIRSMAGEVSTGLPLIMWCPPIMRMWSITAGSGGVGCPRAGAYIGRPMVILKRYSGDICQGMFKNGLKHGEGFEKFSNGDSYKGQYVNGLP
jgi:hypothetical protein